jgi:hypothetical protein
MILFFLFFLFSFGKELLDSLTTDYCMASLSFEYDSSPSVCLPICTMTGGGAFRFGQGVN